MNSYCAVLDLFWFRSKLKQTEMECEYLKRWFGSLTEQNHRLHREVEELRAMNVGPPTVTSASSLTMCPRCERVTTAASAASPSLAIPSQKTLPPQESEHWLMYFSYFWIWFRSQRNATHAWATNKNWWKHDFHVNIVLRDSIRARRIFVDILLIWSEIQSPYFCLDIYIVLKNI